MWRHTQAAAESGRLRVRSVTLYLVHQLLLHPTEDLYHQLRLLTSPVRRWFFNSIIIVWMIVWKQYPVIYHPVEARIFLKSWNYLWLYSRGSRTVLGSPWIGWEDSLKKSAVSAASFVVGSFTCCTLIHPSSGTSSFWIVLLVQISI